MIKFNDPIASILLSNATSARFIPNVDNSIARYDNDGILTGGMLYTEYNGSTVSMHVAGLRPHWADRAIVWIAFDFPFIKLKCKKVFGTVKASNIKALNLDLHLGFKIETFVTDVFPDGDGMFVLSMYKEECRFLNMKQPYLKLEESHGREVIAKS